MQNSLNDYLKPDLTLSPLPTCIDSRGERLTGIKSVIFDIYGTLLISGSGDVGTAMEAGSAEAFSSALNAAGIENVPAEASEFIKSSFFELIEKEHNRLRETGYPHPEVDIVSIWKDISGAPELNELIPGIQAFDPSILAAAYESTVNPVNMMPGAALLLEKLKTRGLKLGIVSNAQFYTPIVFESALGDSFHDFGFEPSLCLFSYIERRSKPDTALFDKLTGRLSAFNINPAESIFVGNDMLKDIMPSSVTGYKTALFAGDKRSLRLRKDHDACSNIEPDVIVNNLLDLLDFIQEG